MGKAATHRTRLAQPRRPHRIRVWVRYRRPRAALVHALIQTQPPGQTELWYYSTAVDTGNNESAPSNIVQAVIPTP